jgi:hypothetical protein
LTALLRNLLQVKRRMSQALDKAQAAGLDLIALHHQHTRSIATLREKLKASNAPLQASEARCQQLQGDLAAQKAAHEVVVRQHALTTAAAASAKADLAVVLAGRDATTEAALEKVCALEAQLAASKAATAVPAGTLDASVLADITAKVAAARYELQTAQAESESTAQAVRDLRSAASARDAQLAELQGRLDASTTEVGRARARIHALEQSAGTTHDHGDGGDAEALRQQMAQGKAAAETLLGAMAALLRESNDKCAALLLTADPVPGGGKRPRAADMPET